MGESPANIISEHRELTFALAGNQNSGKTTLFNALTGSNQHVGNWPGVTVEHKEGRLRKHKNAVVVDLPGIYSLSPYTPEEVISRNFIIDGGVDAIINIVDATNIERNLYLTLQLAELGKPMVIALNMMDEVKKQGDNIDVSALEKELGIPVVPISAKRGEGVDSLIARAVEAARSHTPPPIRDICRGQIHEALHSIMILIEKKADAIGVTPRFAATKLVEGDELILERLNLAEDELHIIEEIVTRMENNTGMERDAALADARYKFITDITQNNVKKRLKSGEAPLSAKIDSVITHRIFALPIFFGIVMLVFWITFGPIGTYISDGFSIFLEDIVADGIASGLQYIGLSPESWVYGLAVDGVLNGIISVLGFLPVILILFLLLSILEDTGYMARAAFILDRAFRKIGLSGRSCIPMIMGFGCSVPAIMAARILENERDRRLTMIITPFMSCGAKLYIYLLFVDVFFDDYRWLAMTGIYALGIVVSIVSSYILKSTVLKGGPTPFVMELPTYRLPSLSSVIMLLFDKGKGFLRRAFTVIFAATVIIWFLQTFDFSLSMVSPENSMLASIGKAISWVFAPLGFGTWQASTAVITGISAKEIVVSTLAIITGVGEEGAGSPMMFETMRSIFTPLSAFSFMAFNLLAMPCVAAVGAARREMGSFRWTVMSAAYQTGVAWVVSFLIYQIGSLLARLI